MGYVLQSVSRPSGGGEFPDPSTNYTPLGGQNSVVATEAETQVTFRTAAGTFDKAGVYVTTNTVHTLASTFRVRVNGANVNNVISITASTTG